MVDGSKFKDCNNERCIFQWKIKTKELVCSTVEIVKARNEAMWVVTVVLWKVLLTRSPEGKMVCFLLTGFYS